MGRLPQLLDRWGNPVNRGLLTEEVAVPSVTGVRSPISGTPADGLTPVRLAAILREADEGDPLRYLELAETIEERDPHYLGVLGTRRRSVAQLPVTVEAASEDRAAVRQADLVRDWLTRDELQDEVFDLLDAIGKGWAFTEIIWDRSGGTWYPARLEWRDPRWFRFARSDLATPRLLDAGGQEVAFPAYKFICATMKAKSGLALRGGLARVAAWGWMFKAYTQRDWAIFTQTYGQPLRLGKYGPGASERDRDTLFRAVANIAGDCAAIIPESMTIDFVEAGNVGAATDLYRDRADWLDRQISKAVLGQTATTDAIAGGHAVGREHRQVQEDIERADARALAAILNRDLIRPWIDLEFGRQETYPRLVFARPDQEDLETLTGALTRLVPLGLKVSMAEVRDKLGLAEPGPEEETLSANLSPPRPGEGPEQASIFERMSGVFQRGDDPPGVRTAPQAEGPSAARSAAGSGRGDPAPGSGDWPVADLADRLAVESVPEVEALLGQIEAMFSAAGSLEELREMLLAGFPDLDAEGLARVMGEAILAARIAGRVVGEAENDG